MRINFRGFFIYLKYRIRFSFDFFIYFVYRFKENKQKVLKIFRKMCHVQNVKIAASKQIKSYLQLFSIKKISK